jgi:hypothetical protein
VATTTSLRAPATTRLEGGDGRRHAPRRGAATTPATTRLDGGAGDDRLVLDEGGRDEHVGGAGADVFDSAWNAWQDLAGRGRHRRLRAGEDRLELRLELDGGGLFTGATCWPCSISAATGRLDAADAAVPPAAGPCRSPTSRSATPTASLAAVQAGPGSGRVADGYALCLFGVTGLAGSDLV